MTKTLILRQDAEDDVEVAFSWYDKQRPGLGPEFLLSVEAGLAAIQREPELYAIVYRRARRHLLRRFPYALYFVVEGDLVEVIACSHMRRHPRRWRQRV
ncbi:MAG: type II toxin-antitoxin system RelE/ParE family toxin [Gemmatimonadota bacterium]|nr:type II toxin-antitoxin system RelE/ParE family toxin [Gemmatimonadota bacterium]